MEVPDFVFELDQNDELRKVILESIENLNAISLHIGEGFILGGTLDPRERRDREREVYDLSPEFHALLRTGESRRLQASMYRNLTTLLDMAAMQSRFRTVHFVGNEEPPLPSKLAPVLNELREMNEKLKR